MRNLSKGRIWILGLSCLALTTMTNSCIDELDVTPPIVTILHPATNNVVTGTVPIIVTASDDEKVKEIRLFIDGVSVSTEGGNTMNFSWNSASVTQNASHNIAAYAQDDNGNVGPSAITTVTVTTGSADDQVAPVVTAISPANGSTVSKASLVNANGVLNVVADASDESGIANVEFFIDGVSMSVVIAEPYLYAWDVSNADETIHSIFMKATDNNNNSSGQLITVTLTP